MFCRVSLVNKAIDSLPVIWATFEGAPPTLIHNDCSPRNICLRRPPSRPSLSSPHPPLTRRSGGASDPIPFQDPRSLCIYDWELATVGVAQYDVAEFLSFTLQPSTPPAVWLDLLEFHRHHLEYYSGVNLPQKEYADFVAGVHAGSDKETGTIVCDHSHSVWGTSLVHVHAFSLSPYVCRYQSVFHGCLLHFAMKRLALHTMAHTHKHYQYLPRVVDTLFSFLAEQTKRSDFSPALAFTARSKL